MDLRTHCILPVYTARIYGCTGCFLTPIHFALLSPQKGPFWAQNTFQIWRGTPPPHQSEGVIREGAIKANFVSTMIAFSYASCSLAIIDIQGGPKKRGHSTFTQISRKLLKISKWFFAHIKVSVCLTCCICMNFSNSFYSVAPSGECWTIITNT